MRAFMTNAFKSNETTASAAAHRRLESSRNRMSEQRLKPSVAAAAVDVASAASPTTETTTAAADSVATEDTRRADALAIAEKTDWSDLMPAGAGFRIAETAERGLQLEQLDAVFAHLQRRVQSELWMARPPGGQATPVVLPEAVTLYTCATYVILPATVREKTSLVELVATGPQLPRWFVSHWWGEPVADFLACLTQHAKDRELSGESACYWICAYANNQWELSDSLSDDPFQTSFNKALSMVRGTVTIIDGGGVVYSRIWCAFEAYVTITTGRPEYKWDVYTTHMRAGSRLTAGITDGLAEADSGDIKRKSKREKAFPLALGRESLSITLETAKASVDADRVHILNAMVGAKDLNAPPPAAHADYDWLNAVIRAKFALATLRKAIASGKAEPFLRTISSASIRRVDINLEECDGFNAEIAAQLGASMPTGVESLTLRLQPYFSPCARNIDWGRFSSSLTRLVLNGNQIGKEEVSTIFHALRDNTSSKLEVLELEGCGIDDDGADAVAAFCAGCASVTSVSLLANLFNDATVAMLIKLKEEKPTLTTLCGLKPDQTEANFRGKALMPQDAKLLALETSVHASVTSVSLLANRFDDATVAMLLKLKAEKPALTTLCGLKPDQTDANFSDWGLTPQDAKLLAPEILVHASVTLVSLLANRFDDATVAMLLKLKEEKPTLTTLCGLQPDQTKANFRSWGLTPQDAKLLAPEILVHASLTSVR